MTYVTSAAYSVVALLLMLSLNTSAVVGEALVQVQRVAQNRRLTKTTRQPKARIDYSKFSHLTHVDKEKPACDSCHKFPTTN